MTQQYQHNANTNTTESDKKWHKPNRPEKDISRLNTMVEQQQLEINELKSTVRKLQNEVRVAVNAFNLKNHG
jgi:predicted RNase H-like nuclease (RuvC/YqgF family)